MLRELVYAVLQRLVVLEGVVDVVRPLLLGHGVAEQGVDVVNKLASAQVDS